MDGSFDTPAKLDAAIKYTEKSAFDKNEFVESCGVGVQISGEDIENAVAKAIKVDKNEDQNNEKKIHSGVKSIFSHRFQKFDK